MAPMLQCFSRVEAEEESVIVGGGIDVSAGAATYERFLFLPSAVAGAAVTTLSSLSSAFGLKEMITPPPPPPPSAFEDFVSGRLASMGIVFSHPPPPPPDALHTILFD